MNSFEKSNYTKEIIDFHLPRYEEIPNISLYMDQVIEIVKGALDIFKEDEKDKVVTPSMVNNYVKQGVVTPPVKKKYSRNHVAYIIVVCILKQVLSISEVSVLIEKQISTCDIKTAYNYFASQLESALIYSFTGKINSKEDNISINTIEEARVVRIATRSFAGKMYLRDYIRFLNDNNINIK